MEAFQEDAVPDILTFVFGDDDGFVMALTPMGGFFDESIRDKRGGEPISLAGYIFKPPAYRRFSRAWRRMLGSGPTPTTHFHMTNLYARDYEYEGWSVDERAAYLKLAVDAIKENFHFGISVMFRQADFERLAPEDWADKFGSIYSAACQMVLRSTAFWMDAHKTFTPIAYAFESGHKFWDEADAILAALGKDPFFKQRYRYKTHFPLDKRESY